MVEISWTLLIAVVMFLFFCCAVIVAEIYNERNALRLAAKFILKQLDEARTERDEARREVCEDTASHRSRPPFRRHYREEIATERGWSYLYETEDK